MSIEYDLTQLDSHSFEHLVNFLAMSVLGNGITGFAEGPDGGKDGYFVGKAPYPSESEQWEGVWFLQSKFHKPHLSKDPQKWLIKEVKKEISAFIDGSRVDVPDIWIFATNIQPSGQPHTGAYDRIKKLVSEFNRDIKVEVWGGRKILDFLARDTRASQFYGHFLTPGHIITELYESLKKNKNEVKSVIDSLIVNQFYDLCFTKLEQAGGNGDQRPAIYDLFTDLPIKSVGFDECYNIMDCLVSASNNVQTNTAWCSVGSNWKEWAKNPKRARVLLLKGGPGQGKSTVGQYFAQIQRAAFILSPDGPNVTINYKEKANELSNKAKNEGFWPAIPRIPLFVELKDYANWYIKKGEGESRNIVEYVCQKIQARTSKKINESVFCEALTNGTWFINFDGLDEVPNDVKDDVANEVINFTNELIPSLDCDALILCTTRPQGYSGQFDNLFPATANLVPLPPNIALKCATAVINYNRSEEESAQSLLILQDAMSSDQVQGIMTTPLQSHIMAVVVRDGGRPPERRWELFNNFYTVMKKRESQKNFPNKKISALLREKEQLLKSVHDRLGISLHAKAEKSDGAEAKLNRDEFRELVSKAAHLSEEGDVAETIETLMEATTERLVFVNTPESSSFVRFDVRQLQEFFAAEFIYNAVSADELKRRFEIICGDSHWREVAYFILSALTYGQRTSEITISVEVIQSLDDFDDNYKIRAFKKRMSTGALLALRLLDEGVLEQDKRLRKQFLKSLNNLWNVLECDTLIQIININKEQTRAAMTRNMIDAFLELDYSEHLCIGSLLAFIIESDDERRGEIKSRFLLSPHYYLRSTIFLVHALYTRMDKSIKLGEWYIEVLIDLLFIKKSEYRLLHKSILSFLTKYTMESTQQFNSLNISVDKKNLLISLFNVLSKDGFGVSEEIYVPKHLENKYCYIVPYYFSQQYMNDISSEIDLVEEDCGDYSDTIAFLKICLVFIKNQKVEDLKRLVLMAKKDLDFYCPLIPNAAMKYIPIDFYSPECSRKIDEILGFIDKYKPENVKNIIDCEHHFPTIRYISFSRGEFTIDKWNNLCRDYPSNALSLFNDSYFTHSEINKMGNESVLELISPLLSLPDEYNEDFV